MSKMRVLYEDGQHSYAIVWGQGEGSQCVTISGCPGSEVFAGFTALIVTKNIKELEEMLEAYCE